MAIPQTSDEAVAQGYQLKKLTLEEAKKLMESQHAIAGWAHKPVPKDCSTIPANGKCWEGDCIGGWKEVLYCDGTQGCTQQATVRC